MGLQLSYYCNAIRAREAGIDDVGFGVLYGLYDYKYENYSNVNACRSFGRDTGVGPHTLLLCQE